jgi:hypothetical protein
MSPLKRSLRSWTIPKGSAYWVVGWPAMRTPSSERGRSFWFPLRDAIANYLYEGTSGPGGRWPGYAQLFDALELPLARINVLPPGHPKNFSKDARAIAEVEIVAELAGAELDAAFVVETKGERRLYLLEGKWLSGLGGRRRVGAAGFALNQVQRGVALGAWLRQLDDTVRVVYTICATEGDTESASDAQPDPTMVVEIAKGSSSVQCHQNLLVHLNDLLNTGDVLTARRTWRGLASALRDGGFDRTAEFLERHGQGRLYRGRPAALIPQEGQSNSVRVRLMDLDPTVIAEAVAAQGARFDTRQVSRPQRALEAHGALVHSPGYDGAMGRYLDRHQVELGFKRAGMDRSNGAAVWVKPAAEGTSI